MNGVNNFYRQSTQIHVQQSGNRRVKKKWSIASKSDRMTSVKKRKIIPARKSHTNMQYKSGAPKSPKISQFLATEIFSSTVTKRIYTGLVPNKTSRQKGLIILSDAIDEVLRFWRNKALKE